MESLLTSKGSPPNQADEALKMNKETSKSRKKPKLALESTSPQTAAELNQETEKTEEIKIRKLSPLSRPTGQTGTDIYVSRKRHLFGAYCRRALNTLICKGNHDCNGAFVTIHGLGAAILTACKVALWLENRLEKRKHKLTKKITTSSVELLDEHTITKQGQGETKMEKQSLNVRTNSAIHIRLSLT